MDSHLNLPGDTEFEIFQREVQNAGTVYASLFKNLLACPHKDVFHPAINAPQS